MELIKIVAVLTIIFAFAMLGIKKAKNEIISMVINIIELIQFYTDSSIL